MKQDLLTFLSAPAIKEVEDGIGRPKFGLFLPDGDLLLHLAETFNGHDLVPLLSSAKVATPRYGPVVNTASSTSRPTCQ
jgi:hypothetical protein